MSCQSVSCSKAQEYNSSTKLFHIPISLDAGVLFVFSQQFRLKLLLRTPQIGFFFNDSLYRCRWKTLSFKPVSRGPSTRRHYEIVIIYSSSSLSPVFRETMAVIRILFPCLQLRVVNNYATWVQRRSKVKTWSAYCSHNLYSCYCKQMGRWFYII